MPWTGICTDPGGGINSCCHQDRAHDPDLYYGPVADYENSEYLKNLKAKFLAGEYPESCYRCKWNDEAGLISKRVRENKVWLETHNIEDYDKQKYSIVDLRLSNKCNLLCITCNPKNSSSIFNEVKNTQQETLKHYKYVFNNVETVNLTAPYSDSDIDELIKRIEPDSKVYLVGGEPSIMKPVAKILDRLIELGYNKTITLDISSNFETFNQKWLDQLKLFKGTIMPSIDAVGAPAELIRYGCTWANIDRNVKEFMTQCKDIKVMLYPTVSILNIFYLRDIIQWGKELGVEVTFQNRLHEPDHYNIRHLPLALKKKAMLYLHHDSNPNYYNDIKKHLLQSGDESAWKTFINEMDKVDKLRGTNWRTILTNLADF